jgi:hypothetical protein
MCYGEEGHILIRANDGSDDFLVLHCSYLRLTATRPFGMRHLIGFLAYSSARQDLHHLDQSLCVSSPSWTSDLSRLSAPSRARQNLHRLHQALLVLVELDAGPLQTRLLANELVQLHWRQLAHEDRGEECERAFVALQEVVDTGLTTDTINKRLAADLVVRLQDIVDVLDDEVLVARGASGWSGMLEADDCSDTVDVERVTLELGCGVSLAAVKRLVRLCAFQNDVCERTYLFCRLSLK